MPTYIYEAINEDGLIVRGVLDAETRSVALSRLRQYRFQIRNLDEQTGMQSLIDRLVRINAATIAIFTRQLANMLKAGLPIMRCFDLLSTKGENRRFENIVLLIKEQVKVGSSLSGAMARFPEAFNPVYLALVKSGEVSGEISEVLDRIATYLEKDLLLKRRIRAAMSYPLVVFVFCVFIALALVLYIFPKFIELFDGFHLEMPLPTRLLMALVVTLRNPFVILFFLACAGVAIFLVSQYLKTTLGKRHFHHWLLSLPLFGPINRKIAVARFARTFGTLYGSGIPVMHALDITSKVTGNEIINAAIAQAEESVKYGNLLSAPLSESGYFPPMVISMIQVGEQTGYLHTMMEKIADYYDSEVELSLIALTKLIEPFLIGFMGILVGFIVLSIFMPIYQLIGNFGK